MASTIASNVPSSSRWTGPTFVIAATSGSAISQSSAIWPIPRIAISITSSSVSGGAARIASGIPISVLKFSGLAWTRRGRIARQMSLTDVFPVEPVIPTVGQPSSRRQARASVCSAAQRVVDREDPRARLRALELGAVLAPDDDAPGAVRRAPRRRRRRRPALAPGSPKKRSPGADLARVDDRPLGPRAVLGRGRRLGRADGGGDPLRGELDHAPLAGGEPLELLAGDLAVVEGDLPAALELLALLVALAGDHDEIAGRGPAERQRDRRPAVGLDLDALAAVGGDPLEDLLDDRVRDPPSAGCRR